MDEFWEIVGNEVNLPRVCGRKTPSMYYCPVIVSGNPDDCHGAACIYCKRHYVICTCGAGLSAFANPDQLICIQTTEDRVCPRLGANGSNADQENQ